MKQKNTVLMGLQWGDEGKGKVIDFLAGKFDNVIRYHGGHNAGHTIFVGKARIVLHLLPSGVLHKGVDCFIGNGVVLDMGALNQELKELKKYSDQAASNLFISELCHLIFPYHSLVDSLREKSAKLGTTKRGIGVCYEDKYARRGIRLKDLADPAQFSEKLKENLEYYNFLLKYYFNQPKLDFGSIFHDTLLNYENLKTMVKDVTGMLHQKHQLEQSFLFEGAQGSFLDVDFGTYPFVTSSHCTSGSALIGSGASWDMLDSVLGVVKAYTTRVGEGPFPTELHNSVGEHIGAKGKEFGATTGRKRRVGWLDAEMLKKAVQLNGVSEVCLTKLDVLDELAEIKVGVKQDSSGQVVYQTFKGWQSPTYALNDYEQLPQLAKDYVAALQEIIRTKISFISTGEGREHMITLCKS